MSQPQQKEVITVFDDGSDESKVLIYECQHNPQITLNIIKIDPGDINDIEKYFSKVQLPDKLDEQNGPVKVWHHYTNTHFSELLQEARNPDDTIAREGLDRRLAKIITASKDKKGNPKLSIWGPYQNMHILHVKGRGELAGIIPKKKEEEKEKPTDKSPEPDHPLPTDEPETDT